MSDRAPESYADYKDRLDEIVDAVSDENISLDDALALYEEAVKVGLKLSDRLESDISEQEAEDAGQDLEGAQGETESSAEAIEDAENSKTSSADESFEELGEQTQSEALE